MRENYHFQPPQQPQEATTSKLTHNSGKMVILSLKIHSPSERNDDINKSNQHLFQKLSDITTRPVKQEYLNVNNSILSLYTVLRRPYFLQYQV
jgi:TATA-box binding protein (TBP) (component of TFIID and TFIIIB)